MTRELQIVVACGSGVATSTVAMEIVKGILKEAGLPAKLYKCSLGELESKQAGMDLILTTSNYKKKLAVPVISVFGLISGVNADQVKGKLLETCHEILAR